MRRNILIKVSGDEYSNPAFLAWIKELVKTAYVVICVGGGTQIKEEFRKRGFPEANYGPLGRETTTLEERQIARDVLERNQTHLQNLLADQGIHVPVVIPLLDIAGVLCHINGDQYLITAYLGFDTLYVVTVPERVAMKQEQFAHLPKIQVKPF